MWLSTYSGKGGTSSTAIWTTLCVWHPPITRHYVDIMTQFGLELSPTKCTTPLKAIKGLGFRIDAHAMQVTIPDEIITDTLIVREKWVGPRLG